MLKKILHSLFGTAKETPTIENDGRFIVASINDKILPIFRGEHYEDPLDEFLKSNQMGEVSGGGTMMEQSGEIDFCDVEIQLTGGNNGIDSIQKIIGKLEELGAPKGSTIIIEETQEKIEFGRLEGLAVYLDGVNLPNSVYQECDSNFVLTELKKLTGDTSNVERYWQGSTETGLYYYSDSFDEMSKSIADFINEYPLCKNARIVKIA